MQASCCCQNDGVAPYGSTNSPAYKPFPPANPPASLWHTHVCQQRDMTPPCSADTPWHTSSHRLGAFVLRPQHKT